MRIFSFCSGGGSWTNGCAYSMIVSLRSFLETLVLLNVVLLKKHGVFV